MNALELKDKLHRLIVETSDPNILSRVEAYFNSLIKKTDWWDELSDEQKEQIEIAKQQIENGEGIPHAKVQEEARNLLLRKKNK